MEPPTTLSCPYCQNWNPRARVITIQHLNQHIYRSHPGKYIRTHHVATKQQHTPVLSTSPPPLVVAPPTLPAAAAVTPLQSIEPLDTFMANLEDINIPIDGPEEERPDHTQQALVQLANRIFRPDNEEDFPNAHWENSEEEDEEEDQEDEEEDKEEGEEEEGEVGEGQGSTQEEERVPVIGNTEHLSWNVPVKPAAEYVIHTSELYAQPKKTLHSKSRVSYHTTPEPEKFMTAKFYHGLTREKIEEHIALEKAKERVPDFSSYQKLKKFQVTYLKTLRQRHITIQVQPFDVVTNQSVAYHDILDIIADRINEAWKSNASWRWNIGRGEENIISSVLDGNLAEKAKIHFQNKLDNGMQWQYYLFIFRLFFIFNFPI